MKSTSTNNLRKLLSLLVALTPWINLPAAELDTSSMPSVRVQPTDPVALEGSSSGAFTVTRSGSVSNSLAIRYVLSGSASNGVDYTLLPETITIPANHLAADIVVVPIQSAMIGRDKAVVLTLASNANYRISEHASARVEIVDDRFDDLPPAVSITSPTNGSGYLAPALIAIQAEASDTDGAVAKVSFYVNDDFLGEDLTSPFSYVWTNARSGKYALFARATDTNGLSTLSRAVSIVITNASPSIVLLSPTNGTMIAAQSSITMEARASATNGLPLKVQFFADSRFLGLVSAPPYQFTWARVPAGAHVVAARAIDSAEMTATAYATIVATNKNSLPKLPQLPDREEKSDR